jgi:ATP-dependent Lon protease
MSQNDDFTLSAKHFSGTVRLFPLPNLVLFPNVMQPLQIFEPRYLEMLDDTLADDRLLGVVLLKPGWEADYEGRPAIASTVCVGRILSHQMLDDGRQNVLLVGLKRGRIINELAPRRSYREAVVELIEDQYPAPAATVRARLHRELLDSFKELASKAAGKSHPFESVLSGQVPLGMLTDLVTYVLPLELAFKQSMLAEKNVDRRARKLLDRMKSTVGVGSGSATQDSFPPPFSSN